MHAHRVWQTYAFAALLLAGSVSAAALAAHAGIDAAGDVLLAHDTYDGLDHHSRSGALGVALVLGIGALLRVLWCALDEATTGRAAKRPTLDTLVGRGRLRFVGAVATLTVPALMLMELGDIVAAGGRCGDVTDLLGGSAWLGLAITLPVAIGVALCVRSVAAFLVRSHGVLVAVIGQLLSTFVVRVAQPVQSDRTGADGRWSRRRSILSRRSGKRGPPIFAS